MFNQNHFNRKIIIKAPIEEVFNAWTIQREIETWFLKSAQFKRDHTYIPADEHCYTGDSYEWIWHSWPENTQTGEIVVFEQNERYGFSFEPAGDVHIEFTIEASGVLVNLEQKNIPLENNGWYNYFYGCSLGWSFWLVNLKSYLENGFTLDHRDDLVDMANRMQFVNH